jgi:hypothetical protein
MATGHKGQFTLGTVTTGLNVISIKPATPEVGKLALPHLGLAVGDNMPYEPLELVEGGEYVITYADDNNTQLVHSAQTGTGATFKKLLGLVQTCTYTRPPAAGLTNGATTAFSGFATKDEPTEATTGQRATRALTVVVAGNLTLTAGS